MPVTPFPPRCRHRLPRHHRPPPDGPRPLPPLHPPQARPLLREGAGLPGSRPPAAAPAPHHLLHVQPGGEGGGEPDRHDTRLAGIKLEIRTILIVPFNLFHYIETIINFPLHKTTNHKLSLDILTMVMLEPQVVRC